jgi:RHS repeat-associated protein
VSQPLSQTSLRIRAVLSSIRRRTATRWWYKVGFTVLSICLIGAAKFDSLSEARAAIRHYAANARAVLVATAPDTAVFFGPKQFVTVNSSTQINFAESFSVPPLQSGIIPVDTTGSPPPWAPNPTEYRIRLSRVGGSLTTATVAINGTQVATAADFAGVNFIERAITVHQVDFNTNSLTISLKGATGAGLIATVVGTPSATLSIFGPKSYVKTATTPTHYVDSFVLSSGTSGPYTMSATASSAGTKATITLNGVQVIKDVDFGSNIVYVAKTVSLLSGNNSLVLDVRGNTNKTITLYITGFDKTPPTLTITAPAPNFVTNASTVTVSGMSQDLQQTQVKVNGIVATMSGPQFTQYSATVPLNPGANSIAIRATDVAGNHTDSTRTVTRDTVAPTLTVTTPADGSYTNQDAVTVAGTVSDATTVTVKVNGVSLPVGQGGAFSGSYTLAAGANFLTITATDAGGNVTSLVRKVTQAKQPPVLTVTAPTTGFIKNTTPLAVSGTVTGTTPITVSANGVGLTVTGSSFSGSVPLVQGANDIAITATDPAGNTTVVHRTGSLDTHAPVLTLTAPVDASYSNATTATVSGTATDESSFTVTVNGTAVTVAPNGTFSQSVTLVAGANPITVTATDAATNATTLQRSVTQDRTPPALTVTTPADGSYSNATAINVSGTASDASPLTVKVNGSPATVNPDGSFTYSAPLTSGSNTILVIATDAATNATTASRTIIQDRDPPVLSVDIPVLDSSGSEVTNAQNAVVIVTATDASPVTVTLNGVPLTVDANGKYSGSIPLSEGFNPVAVVVTDAAGNNASSELISIYRDTQPPVVDVESPVEGAHFDTEPVVVSGTITDANTDKNSFSVSVNGVSVTPVFGTPWTFSTSVHLATGSNAISIVVREQAGNTTTLTRTVTFGGAVDNVPPDPSTVAPALDPTVATTTFAATSFLYSGPNPIQTGVVVGTIRPLQAAVIRGTVRTRTGEALPAVKMTVLDRPEFGQTLSRADGAFDLVVNGGEPLTVNYQKAGFLPAQRTVSPIWQEYTSIDSVTLVGLDPAVTTVDFSEATQVAQGTPVTDASGTRQATVLFKSGTHAALKFADGTTQPINSIAVRATEYTVGPTGPSAMPAQLPPTTAYTYAVELSADTAIAAGASGVVFDQPVAFYVDNFLNFPIGKPVPVGYYDRENAQWVASPNGRIIKVLEVVSGRASIDVDGAGTEATAEALAALGVNEAELARLGTLFASGKSFWRVSLTHFSTIDLNYGQTFDTTSVPPTSKNPATQNGPDDDCNATGSIIGCERQTLGESLPIAGTSLSLDYQSDRTPGYKKAYSADVPLIGDIVPFNLQRIVLEVRVAGRVITGTYSTQPNQTAHFVWDGKDPYGRPVQGSQLARVRIGYVYPTLYANVVFLSLLGDFGNYAREALSQDRARSEATLWQDMILPLGTYNRSGEGLGGWGINVHHYYDPMGRVLYLGDGSRRTGSAMSNSTTTIAGCTTNCANNIAKAGDRAVDDFIFTEGIALAKDGTMYLTDGAADKIWHVNTAGILELVAGNGTAEPNGDGIAATSAGILPFGDVKVGPDNSIYFADFAVGQRIRRVDKNGIITTVAGTGVCGSSVADGTLAAQANLCFQDFAFAKDGTLFLETQTEVYRIGSDGILKRVVGDGTFVRCPNTTPSFVCAEGKPANAHGVFHQLRGIAVAADGSLYVANREFRVVNGMVIYRIGSDGIIHRVAGNGNASGPLVDGFPATTSSIVSTHSELGVGPDGTLYFTENAGWVYRVDERGILRIIAGCVSSPGPGVCSPNSGGRAKLTTLDQPRALDFGPDGRLYILDRIARRVDAPLPALGINTLTVASEDGRELYVFDPDGRHLRTIDALLGTTIFNFAYDAMGRLSSVSDGTGNATSIERDGVGTPIWIVPPFGQRTALTTDVRQYLSSVTAPGRPAFQLVHTAEGLLTDLRDPKGILHQLTYDGNGLLIRDDNGGGGTTILARVRTDSSSSVTRATGMGTQVVYTTTSRSVGGSRQVTIDSDGLPTTLVTESNGTVVSTGPEGTVTTVTSGPDPRFGLAGPVINRTTTRTPAGLSSVVSGGRRTVLSNPANPLSLVSQVDSLVVNGGVFRSTYVAATHTLTAVTATGRTTTRQLDSLGRVIEETTAGLTPLTYQYDASGRLAQMAHGVGTWGYGYDSNGRLESIADPFYTTSFAYDSAGDITLQTLPGGRQIHYGYDSNGNLTSLTPPGKPAHQFVYNAGNLLTSYNPPTLGAGTWNTTYQYDLDRKLTLVTRPDGETIGFEYDSAGRAKTVNTSHGAFAFGYNASSGMLSSISAPDSETLDFTYDGSLLTGVTWGGEIAGTMTVTYNNDFQATTLSVNGDQPTQFVYDAEGLVQSAGALSVSRSATNGLISGTVLGLSTTTRTYTSLGDVNRRSASLGDTLLFDVSYGRDAIGRISDLTETTGGTTTTKAYTYDNAGRLSEVRENGSLTAVYEYDANGNRARATRPLGVEVGVYDDQDRVVSYGSASFDYSRSGELRSRTVGTDVTHYEYDAQRSLRQVTLPNGTLVNYIVDGMNRRVGKKVNGQLVQGLLYQSRLSPIAELDGAGQLKSRFVYATHETVPDYLVKGGVTYRIVTDHVGSVRMVFDVATGVVVQRMNYDEFGRVTLNSNPGFQPFGFAGGIYDEQTGLVRLGTRDYDPETGRWTTTDPVGFLSGDANLYAYISNDPINRTDPTGLGPESQNCTRYQTRYGHLSKRCVERGQHVEPGDILGLSGNTGVGTGPHLHFEVRKVTAEEGVRRGQSDAVDPLWGLQQMGDPVTEYGGRVTGAYNERRVTNTGEIRFHQGVDFRAAVGTQVMAPVAGTVVFSGQASGYGNVVYVNGPCIR